MNRKIQNTYAVALSNGMEEYFGSDRAAATAAFLRCAKIGRCHLVSIFKCQRRYLASSIIRDDASLAQYQNVVRG